MIASVEPRSEVSSKAGEIDIEFERSRCLFDREVERGVRAISRYLRRQSACSGPSGLPAPALKRAMCLETTALVAPPLPPVVEHV